MPKPPVIRVPADPVIKLHFEEYAMALGKVAHAWNTLQESLGELFVAITQLDQKVGFGIWYSTHSDRAQREMLRAAIEATHQDRWNRYVAPKRQGVQLIGTS
jgi:hypothetical protein